MDPSSSSSSSAPSPLLQAIDALYHASDDASRKAACAWLEGWQTSPQAWREADALLHDATRPMEAHYLAAQTLRTKVQHDVEELPSEALPSLRDSLAGLLLAFGRGAPPVRTQLSLALASLAAALPASEWRPSPSLSSSLGGGVGNGVGAGGGGGGGGSVMTVGPVPWLAERLGVPLLPSSPSSSPSSSSANASSADSGLPAMLEFLTVLPQEAEAPRPSLPPARRRAFAAEAAASVPAALAALENAAAGPHGEAHGEAILEAFAAWLRLAPPGSGGGGAGGSAGRGLGNGTPLPAHTHAQSVTAAALASSPLVAATLRALGDSEAFGAAVDAVMELVAKCCSGGVGPNGGGGGGFSGVPDPAAAPLVSVLLPAIMGLRPRFVVASRRAAAAFEGLGDDVDDGGESREKRCGSEAAGGSPRGAGASAAADFDDDGDAAAGMARLFAEVGEAFVEAIAASDAGDSGARAPLEALLEVAEHPDERVAGSGLVFWHRLAKCVTSRGGGDGTGGRGDSSPSSSSAVASFTPAFERLVAAVRCRASWPSARAVSRWRADDRADFRRARAAAADALEDAATVLGGRRTLELLSAPLAEVAAAVAGGRAGPECWRTAEAALFCVRAVSRVVVSTPSARGESNGNGSGGYSPSFSSSGSLIPLRDPLLSSLLSSLPSLPKRPPPPPSSTSAKDLDGGGQEEEFGRLQATAALLVASYSSWLSASVDAEEAAGVSAASENSVPPPAAATERSLLQMLVDALSVREAVPAAASALCRVAAAAGRRAAIYAVPLADLHLRALAEGRAKHGGSEEGGRAGRKPPSAAATNGGGSDTGGENSSSSSLENLGEVEVQLITEAAVIATCALGPAAAPQAVERLSQPLERALAAELSASAAADQQQQQLLAQGGAAAGGAATAASSAAKQHRSNALMLADRLTALLRACTDASAAAAALARVWPLAEAGMASAASLAAAAESAAAAAAAASSSAAAAESNVQRVTAPSTSSTGDPTLKAASAAAEKWCRLVKHAVKSARYAAAPLLPALAASLPRWFAATKASSFLYVSSELVKTFGGACREGGVSSEEERQIAAAVVVLLSSVLPAAVAAVPDEAAARERPDLADDVFLLSARALAYAPAATLAPPLSAGGALLDVAARGLLLQHRDACCSAMHLVERACSPATLQGAGEAGRRAAAEALLPRAAGLARLLLAGALGALPRQRVRDAADALATLLRAGGRAAAEPVAEALLRRVPDGAAPAADRARAAQAAEAVAGVPSSSSSSAASSSSSSLSAAANEWDSALADLAETTRRSARARDAALAALL